MKRGKRRESQSKDNIKGRRWILFKQTTLIIATIIQIFGAVDFPFSFLFLLFFIFLSWSLPVGLGKLRSGKLRLG